MDCTSLDSGSALYPVFKAPFEIRVRDLWDIGLCFEVPKYRPYLKPQNLRIENSHYF